MNYLLAFLGLVGVVVIWATSPLVIRLIEYVFQIVESDSRRSAANPPSTERSELRDEIRRLTAALETGRRDANRL